MSNYVYDAKEIWKNEIQETAEQLIEACRANNMPCILLAAVANDDKKTEYVSSSILPSELGLELHEDYLTNYMQGNVESMDHLF